MEKISDIALAQQIVRSAIINFGDETFARVSAVYRFTNEDIAAYKRHLEDKKRILSVIGGGQQILNSILLGSREIDCFDISIFPEYVFEITITTSLLCSYISIPIFLSFEIQLASIALSI